MQQLPSSDQGSLQLLRRLNRVFGELNVVLLAVAIGLAALDFTCFVSLNASASIARAETSRPPERPFGTQAQARPGLIDLFGR
jgi:hypothetical protein